MKMLKRGIAVALLLSVGHSHAQPPVATDVVISADATGRKVHTATYDATISANGAISSLNVKGQEFLKVAGASRGAYFFQNGNIDLPQISQEEPSTITVKGDSANARYDFKADSLTWTLNNTTDKYMNFFMVFDPAVGVGRSDKDEWAKPPVNGQWAKSTWYGPQTKLEINGATRVWGPWNNLNQVWEATLAPKETRVVELKVGTPDAAELAKVTGLSKPTEANNLPATPAITQTLSLPAFFGDNMVLQREMPNPFWGMALPGEAITVSIGKQNKQATADAAGKWMVKLDPVPVGGPYQIKVTSPKKTLTLKNVLCGDVWLCSGQSNMYMTLHETTDGAQEMLTANDPQLRLFKADLRASETPLTDLTGQWNETSPAPAKYFSAVGYYFGKKLRQELKVPIGLIASAWGGTQIESWISPESLKADSDFSAISARDTTFVTDYKARNVEPRYWNNKTSALYYGMNVPLAPLAIRGVTWYQGEANFGRGYQYRRLFPLLISDWRKLWGRPDLPFVWVQMPNIGPAPTQPSGSGWAETREAQLMTLSVPNTAMATTIELGDPNDIHPKFKGEVGKRLALAALQKVYKRNVVGSGPVYSAMKIEGDKIRLHFKEIGGGLISKDGGPLKGFAIAGKDEKFVWADAKIEGDSVVLSSAEVKEPVAARYAWADTPTVSLYNKAGLPASPFRTDNWPGWTDNNK